jgi:prepilin-type N-terminal cleavage/methylation domain-containing protein
MLYPNLNKNFKKAFSLIELSVVVLIIGILIAGITAGSRLVRNSKLTSMAQFTKSSDVNSISDLVLWLEPTIENSFATTSNNNNDLTYSNLADQTNSSYLNNTLRPDNREYIARWNDINPKASLGNKKSVYQEIGSKRPMYIANAINGLPALQFNGISQFLYSQNNNTTPAAPPIVAGDDSYTLIVVFSLNTSSGDQNLLCQAPNTAQIGQVSAINMPSNSFFIHDIYGVATNSSLSTKTSTAYIGIIKLEDKQILNSNNLSFFLNSGKNNATLDTVTSHSISGDAFLLGACGWLSTANSISTLNGYIGEILVFDRALKNEELTLISQYLSKKWSITL